MAIPNLQEYAQRAIESFDPPLRWPQCPFGDTRAEEMCPELVQLDHYNKGKTTARAVYLMNKDYPHLGLLWKDGGANYEKHSTDFVMDRTTGRGCDIMTTVYNNDGVRDANGLVIGGTRMAVARWGHEEDVPDGIARWRQPTKELAGLTDEPEPEPKPKPDPDPKPVPVGVCKWENTANDLKLDAIRLLLSQVLKNQERAQSGTLFGYTITLRPEDSKP